MHVMQHFNQNGKTNYWSKPEFYNNAPGYNVAIQLLITELNNKFGLGPASYHMQISQYRNML